MKRTHDSILTLELPYREELSIRRTIFDGGGRARVAVVAGIHGDEIEGLYVCHLLARRLEMLEARCPGSVRGRVELYPAMNPLGIDTLQRFVPVFDDDLNRNFPGAREGLLPQRLAEAAVRQLTGADLVIDIHASNIFLREIPQVRIAQAYAPRLVPLAEGMNLDLIWIHGAVTVLEATIAHSLNSTETPCLVVEMGVGMRVTPSLCEQVVTGILAVWQKLGVLSPDAAVPPVTRSPLIADDSNVFYLNAEKSGLFVPEIEHWMTVERDDLLGRIVSPYEPEVLSEVRSPVDGVLFTLREYPVVYEGSLMARITAPNAGSTPGEQTS